MKKNQDNAMYRKFSFKDILVILLSIAALVCLVLVIKFA